jgi:hypothetical protein
MCCGKGRARRRIRPKSGLKKKVVIKEEKKDGPEVTPGQNPSSS